MNLDYPSLLDRSKAATVDAIILIAAMYGLSELFQLFDHVPNAVRAFSWVFLFIIYEPLLVSLYGGTIGHNYFGLTVRRDSQSQRKLSYGVAVLRFAVKVLLGWLSFLVAIGNEKRKTIHDFMSNSVVLYEAKVRERT